MHWPTVTRAFGVSLVFCIFAACNGGSDYSPSAPTAPVVSQEVRWDGALSDWTSDLTLVSCSGNISLCSHVGKTLSGRRWRVALSGATIELHNVDDHMVYRGTMNGRRFVATYPIAWEFPAPHNLEGEAHHNLEGEFAEDFNSFEAVGTFVVNAPPVDYELDYELVWHHRVVRVR